MIIGKKYETILARTLKKRGIHVYELADRIGISRKSMYRYVSGVRMPSVEIALKIAKELNDTVDYLFSDIC